MIDPVEAVIVWLAEQLTHPQGRVAGKHRYGDAWLEDQLGMSVHLDGGAPDLYAPVSEPRFEIRIYADDQPKIVRAWMELTALSRASSRFTVNTEMGTALIHTFLPETVLSLTYDDVLKKDLGILFYTCIVSEEAVSEETQ